MKTYFVKLNPIGNTMSECSECVTSWRKSVLSFDEKAKIRLLVTDGFAVSTILSREQMLALRFVENVNDVTSVIELK